jgi:hypothetical protein
VKYFIASLISAENHPVYDSSFVVYTYLQVVSPTPQPVTFRERKTFSFVCENNEQCQPWVMAIRSALGQNNTTYLVLLENTNKAAETWETIKTMFDISVSVCKVQTIPETVTEKELEGVYGIVVIAGDAKIYQFLSSLLISETSIKKIPIGIVPCSLSKNIEYPLNLKFFFENPILVAFTIIKSKRYGKLKFIVTRKSY